MNYKISKNFYNNLQTPSHWEEKKLKFILSFSEEKSSNWSDEKVLSLTQNGVIERNINDNEGQIAESYENYILVKKGDICMNPMDLLSGWVDISKEDGLISPAYYTFKTNKEFDTKFINYLLQSNYFRKTFFKLGKGVASHDNFGRWVLTPEEIKNFIIFIPTIKEQKIISFYLDKKIKPFQSLIKKIKNKITILKEQRVLKINQCISKGLDPRVKMKESGIEWIGKVPKNWEIKKLKFVSSHIIEKRVPIDGDIKISPENVESNTGKILNYYSDYETEGQRFLKGDILLNKLRVYLNKVVLCDFDGLSMGEMLVIRPKNISKDYLYRMLNSSKFIDYVNSFSQGVKVPRPPVESIFNTFLPIPSNLEQKKISEYLNEYLEKIDMSIDKYTNKINLIAEYRNSLISSVTTGKSKVTEDLL